MEPPQSSPANLPSKIKLLYFALGITFLTISLYLLFSKFADWLPEIYGDSWLVRSIALRILACGGGLLLLHGFVKLFSGQKLLLAFGRITEQQRSVLAKNIVIYFVIIIVQTIAVSFLDLGRFTEGPEIETVQIGLLGDLGLFLFIVVAGPIFEEALFRGFLYARLRSSFKFWPAFMVSGLFFSLLHFDPQGSMEFNIANIFDTLVFSYFVTKTFEETGNLWNPIIFHSVYNGWLMLFFLFTSAFEL